MKVGDRMKIVQIAMKLMSLLVVGALPLLAHTSADTNAVVRALLVYCNSLTDNLDDLPSSVLHTADPYVFFNKIDVGGDWTPEGKRAAFNSFLEEMGGFDFAGKDKPHVYTALLAVGQCRCMNYTNALPAIRRLALNPTYPSSRSRRWNAIEFTIEQMGPSDETTRFVETILTNQTVFTLSERGCASGVYISRLLKSARTEPVIPVMTNAVAAFYRYGKTDTAGGVMFDKLFVSEIPGYEHSSNRLDYANFMVEHPNNNDLIKKYYRAVTNRLHSSGQPLRQLTIGEGGNE